MCRSNAAKAGKAVRTVQDINDVRVRALLRSLDRARIIELTPSSANSFGVFGNNRSQIVVRVANTPRFKMLIQMGIIEMAISDPTNFEIMSIGKPRRELYCGIESALGKFPATGASNSLNT